MCLENNKSLGDRYINIHVQDFKRWEVSIAYMITHSHTLVGTMWKNSSVYKLNKKFLNKMSVMQKGKALVSRYSSSLSM